MLIGRLAFSFPTRFQLNATRLGVDNDIITITFEMSTIRAPSRSLLRALKAPTSKCCCQRIAIRSISTTEGSVPRWSRTPTGMSAPVRVRARPKQEFKVNEDPTKLDAMYNRLLGQNGSKMLHDETKWLAITHKSFDQGRRGFNDRLSFMGELDVE